MSTHSLEPTLRSFVLTAAGVLFAAVCWRVLSDGVTLLACVWAAVCTAPLWGVFSGLLKRNRRAYAFFSLCVIPYLIAGITEAIANPRWRVWAGLVLCVAFLLFVCVIAYLRVTRPAIVETAPRERTVP
jgi:uncharacterized membrane protein